MRKYITLIITFIAITLMTGLNAQVGRASGLSGTGLDGFIEQADLDSIHIGAGKFIYGATGSGQDVTATGVELNYLDIGSLGTGAASKALVLDTGDDYTWPSAGFLTYGGTQITATGLEINVLDGISATLTFGELDYLDIATPGTGVALKAVVPDGSDDYTWPSTGIFTYSVLNDGTTTLTTSALKLNYLDITTLGTQEASKAVTTDAASNSGVSKVTQLWIGASGAETRVTSTAAELNAIPATTATAAELNYVDLTAAVGLVEGTKAMVLDANAHIDEIRTAKISIGATGAVTEVTASAAELNYLDITALGTGVKSKAVVLDGGGDYTWEAGGVFKYAILNDGTTALTTSALKLNYVDITTLGTQEASKVVTTNSDSNSGVSKVTQLWIGSTGAEVQVASTALELDQRALTVKMIDVSSAGQVHVVSPYAGTVTAVYTVLNATIATNPAILTIKDKDGNSMGTITIADGGSGPGDVDSNTSLTNADVAVGDMIEIETNNASTNTVEVEITILIAIQ